MAKQLTVPVSDEKHQEMARQSAWAIGISMEEFVSKSIELGHLACRVEFYIKNKEGKYIALTEIEE